MNAVSEARRPERTTDGRHARLLKHARGQGLVAVLLVLIVVFALASPYFFRLNNLVDIGAVVGILGIMAVAQTLLMISGGIDISLGSVAATAAVTMVIVYDAGVSIWLCAVLALAIGVGVGALNGAITVRLGVDPLVTTLATYSIFQGLAYVISGTRTLIIDSESFAFLGTGDVFGIPFPFILFALVLLVGLFVERFTTFGRAIFAIGGNFEAARSAGIRVDLTRFVLYVASGASGAVAGILVVSQLSSAAPQIGTTYLLAVITAVILGGASLKGGRGSLVGTFVAILILGVLQNGFALLQWSSFAQSIVLGVFLIVAVSLDQRLRATAFRRRR